MHQASRGLHRAQEESPPLSEWALAIHRGLAPLRQSDFGAFRLKGDLGSLGFFFVHGLEHLCRGALDQVLRCLWRNPIGNEKLPGSDVGSHGGLPLQRRYRMRGWGQRRIRPRQQRAERGNTASPNGRSDARGAERAR